MSQSNRANASIVWKHMEKAGDGKAKCKLCGDKFAYVGGSTGGLHNHLKGKHGDVINTPKKGDGPKQSTLTKFGVSSPQRPCSSGRQEKIIGLLANVIAANMLPISFVESAEFREFVNFLEPEYKVPCRQTMTARLGAMKESMAKTLEVDMAHNASAIAVTTDIWTSMANEAYISFTASYISPQWKLVIPTLVNEAFSDRHTGASIGTHLGDIAKEWGIERKVTAVVHYGASNMTDAGGVNGWTDVGCAAHKLHLVVTGAMGVNKASKNPIARCVNAASLLVGHFNHSPLATTELARRQKDMVDKDSEVSSFLKPVQYCKTRWNSVYDMFERLTKIRYVGSKFVIFF
jgi:hypothetical protein